MGQDEKAQINCFVSELPQVIQIVAVGEGYLVVLKILTSIGVNVARHHNHFGLIPKVSSSHLCHGARKLGADRGARTLCVQRSQSCERPHTSVNRPSPLSR